MLWFIVGMPLIGCCIGLFQVLSMSMKYILLHLISTLFTCDLTLFGVAIVEFSNLIIHDGLFSFKHSIISFVNAWWYHKRNERVWHVTAWAIYGAPSMGHLSTWSTSAFTVLYIGVWRLYSAMYSELRFNAVQTCNLAHTAILICGNMLKLSKWASLSDWLRSNQQ